MVCGWVGAGGKLADEPACYPRCDEGIPSSDDPDGVKELLGCGVLEKESRGSGPKGVVDVLIEVERGQHEHPRGAESVVPGDSGSGCNPVELGHPNVHQDDIRSGGERLVDGFGSSRGFANNFETIFGADECAKAATDQFLIVDKKHTNGRHLCSLSGEVVGQNSSH